jgi:hypothetical protein
MVSDGRKGVARNGRSWLNGLLLVSACIALRGVVGYITGARHSGSDLILPVQQKIPLECYLNERSFSEIENATANLEALAVQFLTELRSRHDASALGNSTNVFLGNPLYRVNVSGAIQELQDGIEQFKGTDQELLLVRELLSLLKREKELDRWMDVYLATLYEHPSHSVIRSAGRDAGWISEAAGRQYDLANARNLLRLISLYVPDNEQVQPQTSTPSTATSDRSRVAKTAVD